MPYVRKTPFEYSIFVLNHINSIFEAHNNNVYEFTVTKITVKICISNLSTVLMYGCNVSFLSMCRIVCVRVCVRVWDQPTQRKRARTGSNHHHSGNPKAFNCQQCSRSFLHKHRFLRHMATHTDERPYQCKVCTKAFSQAYYLSRHEKTHTDEKPYQCEICMKAFSQTYYLSRHLKTHSGERPFHCTICQKSFVLSYSLRKHMRTHASAQGS